MSQFPNYKIVDYKKNILLSSSCFSHFTDKIENIVSILSNGFRPFYSLEQFEIKINEIEFQYNLGIPMISFCDLPLTLAKDNLKDYGGYGIGLSKDWIINNKLSPVRYVDRTSSEYNESNELIKEYSNLEKQIGLTGMTID